MSIQIILDKHKKWVESGGKQGECANLREANLSGANLEGADLQGAKLFNASLWGAHLSGVNFRGADLRKAILYGAELGGSDLREANIEKAYLQKAVLNGANLHKANLRRADLHGANLLEANLKEAILWRAILHGADLRGADLSKADLRESNLLRGNLQKANLQEADLRESNLREANLFRADLSGANLQGANLQGADLVDLKLKGTNFADNNLVGLKIDQKTFDQISENARDKFDETWFILASPDTDIIVFSIELPSEYYRTGLAILSNFNLVLQKKHPDLKAKIIIEQQGFKVSMTIDPLSGNKKTYEDALNEYCLVVTGKMTPEEYTDNRILAMDLKNQFILANSEIEMQKNLLKHQDPPINEKNIQIDFLLSLIEKAVQKSL